MTGKSRPPVWSGTFRLGAAEELRYAREVLASSQRAVRATLLAKQRSLRDRPRKGTV